MEPKPKKQKRLCTFTIDYTTKWPCIIRSTVSTKHARCAICKVDFSVSHQGKGDVQRHLSTQTHIKNAQSVNNSQDLKTLLSPLPKKSSTESIREATIAAEIKFTHFLIEHNCPLSAADHAGKLFRSMFCSSSHSSFDIIDNYSCGRSKTTAVVKELSYQETQKTISFMKTGPFSLAIDGSNDLNCSEKLFPLLAHVKISDFCHFLNFLKIYLFILLLLPMIRINCLTKLMSFRWGGW